MNENTKKVLGIGGAIAVVVGTVGMILSGADTTAVSGIVGLAAGALAAILALIAGIKK